MGKIELNVQCPVCNHRHNVMLTEGALLGMLQALRGAQKKSCKADDLGMGQLRNLMDIFGME